MRRELGEGEIVDADLEARGLRGEERGGRAEDRVGEGAEDVCDAVGGEQRRVLSEGEVGDVQARDDL